MLTILMCPVWQPWLKKVHWWVIFKTTELPIPVALSLRFGVVPGLTSIPLMIPSVREQATTPVSYRRYLNIIEKDWINLPRIVSMH